MANIGRIPTSADSLPWAATRKLGYLPGPPATPLVGNVVALRNDLLGSLQKWHTAYGAVFQVRFMFGERVIVALGPQANELVLQDTHRNFASSRGWQDLRRLWGENVLTRDFEDHRALRKLFLPAFKPEQLRGYLVGMNAAIAYSLAQWPRRTRTLRFYPHAKDLTLNIAGEAFAGLTQQATKKLRRKFTLAMAAPVTPIPWAIPGNARWRGERAIGALLRYFAELVPQRRAKPGPDMFSQFCTATDEDGNTLSEDDIASNIMTFLFAAHDTTTAALTNMLYSLASYSEWQEQLREEMQSLTPTAEGGIAFDDLEALSATELVFKESIRLYAPLQFIARRSVSEFEFGGYRLPANSALMVFPHFTHHMADWYWQPDKFDPLRFAEPRFEDKQNPFAFVPFGKGAHMCLGRHFALMEVRAVLFQLLRNYRVELPRNYTLKMQTLPFPRPADGLKLRITPI